MPEAYIIDAVRSPVGKRGGALSGGHPADLGAASLGALMRRSGAAEVSQFRAAEMIAERWSLRGEAMEEFAIRSHERALAARAAGRFDREIEPVGGVTADEGPREPDWAKIRSLPALLEGGRITAAVSSQTSDAA